MEIMEIENLEPNPNGSERSRGFGVKDGEIEVDGIRKLDSDWWERNEEKEKIDRRVLHAKSHRKSSKGERKLDWSNDSFGSKSKKSGIVLIEKYFTNMLRMDGLTMSMPSPNESPTRSPSNGGNENPAVVPSPMPALNPGNPVTPPNSDVPGCGTLSREEVLEEVLEQVTGGSILNDFSTPQGKAFVWMLERDPAQIDPCSYATVEQRYALATFHYSTNGSGWDNAEGWLSGANECSWVGIECNGNDLVEELGANGALSEYKWVALNSENVILALAFYPSDETYEVF
jgi:hypothetical protein